MEFLKFFDPNGVNLNFRINRKDKVSSKESAIFYLIFISFSFYYIFIQLFKYFNLEYINIHTSTNYNPKTILDSKSLSNFMIAFCHGTDGNSTERDHIAHSAVRSSFEWQYKIRNPWSFEDKVKINLKTCEPKDFPESVQSTYTIRLFDGCLCVPNDIIKNYNLSFFQTDSYYSYFAYKLMFKDEILKNSTAYDYYYDYYKTNVQKLTTYFVDSQGNLNDIKNPFNRYINYENDMINPEVSQNTDLMFSLLNVTLDNNFLFPGSISLT
jgi:hypothetical protein